MQLRFGFAEHSSLHLLVIVYKLALRHTRTHANTCTHAHKHTQSQTQSQTHTHSRAFDHVFSVLQQNLLNDLDTAYLFPPIDSLQTTAWNGGVNITALAMLEDRAYGFFSLLVCVHACVCPRVCVIVCGFTVDAVAQHDTRCGLVVKDHTGSQRVWHTARPVQMAVPQVLTQNPASPMLYRFLSLSLSLSVTLHLYISTSYHHFSCLDCLGLL